MPYVTIYERSDAAAGIDLSMQYGVATIREQILAIIIIMYIHVYNIIILESRVQCRHYKLQRDTGMHTFLW